MIELVLANPGPAFAVLLGICFVIWSIGQAVSAIITARKERSAEELKYDHELASQELRNRDAKKQREHEQEMAAIQAKTITVYGPETTPASSKEIAEAVAEEVQKGWPRL